MMSFSFKASLKTKANGGSKQYRPQDFSSKDQVVLEVDLVLVNTETLSETSQMLQKVL